MKLFIIGNGFDRAHNLPTDYWDFRKYLEHYHPDFLYDFESRYSIYPKDTKEYKKSLLWSDFETNLANINEDVIIENAISIDMGLEDDSEVGIEDTLRSYFKEEYQYIYYLGGYLKRWVNGIKVKKARPRTSKICSVDENFYITFNYTSTLEKVYGIDNSQVLHIHGSLFNATNDPIIGHGNTVRLENIQKTICKAETEYDEKQMSICRVVQDYYQTTFKNVLQYMYKLSVLDKKNIEEIFIVGHSLKGVDLPYFLEIDKKTGKAAVWNIIYYEESEKESMRLALISQGIDAERIKMQNASQFYDIE